LNKITISKPRAHGNTDPSIWPCMGIPHLWYSAINTNLLKWKTLFVWFAETKVISVFETHFLERILVSLSFWFLR
jgi:hypothetical protein